MSNQLIPSAIWYNGVIQTMENDAVVSALAVHEGRILSVGNDSDVLSLAGSDTQLIDLQGQWMGPGFIEGHIHLLTYGESLLKLPIRDCSKEAILSAVADATTQYPPGTWIEGGMGWNNEVWEDPSYPTREELDAVAPNHPVLLPRMDGHLVWVNSAAFDRCGIAEDIQNPPRGEFMRTPQGRLQGCASNGAADLLRRGLPPRDSAWRRKAFLAAQEKLLSYGITSINDMGTSYDMVCTLKELYQEEQYHLRFHGAVRGVRDDSRLATYTATCPEIGLFADRFTIRAYKLLGDGAVGAQSAAMIDDYSDRPGHRGLLLQSDEELYDIVSSCAKQGLQVIIHTIGDAAIDQILRVYERVLEVHPVPDHRWHIEHFQLVTGDSVERAARLGVWASMQPLHAPNSASMAMRRLGPQRASAAYAGAQVLKGLGEISWGSDAPVAFPAPLSGIHAAITRQNDFLKPSGGFFPEQAVSLKDALMGYTLWGAKAQFTEQSKGSLAPGKWADFVVLSQDPSQVVAEDSHGLLSIKVQKTVIAGDCVYSAL